MDGDRTDFAGRRTVCRGVRDDGDWRPARRSAPRSRSSVQPVQAQTMITTPTDGLTAGAVKVEDQGRQGDGRLSRHAGHRPGFGTILVVQEIFGVHAHIADMCRRFAKAGYYAIAPELYSREGDPKTYTEIPKLLLREIVSKVPDAQVMGDLDAAVAFAKGEGKADTAKLGITGFCWGGRIVWLYAAHNPAVKAGVAWYGPLSYGPAPSCSPRTRSTSCKDLHGAGARPLRRRRHRHLERVGREDARGAEDRQRRPRRSRRSTSIRTRRTPSTPTTARATARSRRMLGQAQQLLRGSATRLMCVARHRRTIAGRPIARQPRADPRAGGGRAR